MIVDTWSGCYPSNWKGLIVPEAMAHPAKYSSRLIRRIYEHLFAEGWVKAGDCVVDPFGGVALGALDAMRLGLNWYGVELEEKFWKLGNENIELWERKFGRMLTGSAHIANGDSRRCAWTSGWRSLPMEACVTSPPYDEARVGTESGQEHCGQGDQYGTTDGQLGGADDFWGAAREIVEQVYLALEPGGHACWVVKDYVKAKQIVPFCDQWRQLCEAVGFVTLHEHHANLVRNVRTQGTLDGGKVTLQAESKSFFRRLAEKKGSPRIDWETVLCMVKDGGSDE